MESQANNTKVIINTNLQLSGAVAQYGRCVGMVQDLSQQIIGQFSDNLAKDGIDHKDEIELETSVSSSPELIKAEDEMPKAAAPVQVGGMGLRVLWNAIKRLFGFK